MRAIPSLTGLRGVASAWVMLFHVCLVAPMVGAGWIVKVGVLSVGWIGVDLFFVLSGFLLMWTHGADFARPTIAAINRFGFARILRVYPLSLAVLALIAVIFWADPSLAAWYRSDRPANLSASAFVRTALLATRWVKGDGGEWNEPVWSLSVELVGYAAFPLLAWLIVGRSQKAAAAIAVASLAALTVFQFRSGALSIVAIDQIPALVRMGCCFTAGMAMCRVRQSFSDTTIPHAAEASLVAGLLVAACCHFDLGLLVEPAAFALLVFFLSFGVGSLDRFLSSRPVMFLGRISFPLYLVHLTPLLWLAEHCRNAGVRPVAASGLLVADVALCTAAATVLHYLVERPSHRWAQAQLRPRPAVRLEWASASRP